MPNAVVRATNLATNVTREAASDQSGSYSIPFLTVGDYSVTATQKGFQTSRVERVTLQVQQTARVDFILNVGEVSETINVEASAALLQTETSTVGTVIDSAKIVDLPLNGRNFVQLAQLIPGVQAATPGSITVRRGRGSIGQQDAPFGSTGMSANGSRDTANRYFIDGIEFMDYDAMTYSFSPSVDSIAEFKVETSTYSADLGGAPGGQVNMITKRGGNQLHGTLWEFNRNDALTQSYDAIAGQAASTRPASTAISSAQISAAPSSFRSSTPAAIERSSSSTGNPAASPREPPQACASFRQSRSAVAIFADSWTPVPASRSSSSTR